jgi:hypothetical protein
MSERRRDGDRAWREDLEGHTKDKRAHSEARHEQTNDWIARFQLPFERHVHDTYAHSEMVARIMQENLTLRERFENRLTNLERFKAQATLLGGIGLVMLGALTAAVASNLFHIRFTP